MNDLNDLGRAAGQDAVRVLLTEAASAAPALADRQRAARHPSSRAVRRGAGTESADGDDISAERFTLDERGLWYRPPGDEDGARRRVCAPLRVVAMARDAHSNGWALLVEFMTPDMETRRLLIPLAALGGDGSDWRKSLLSAGFLVPSDANRRRWLTEYLSSRRPPTRLRLVDRMGWHGDVFVMSATTSIGAPGAEQVLFYSDAPVDDAIATAGTLPEWREGVGRYCLGNSRLLLVLSSSLAAALLRLAGQESGGFIIRGHSGTGKTTLLRVAASVYGGPRFMRSARGTDNALESLAAQHCDMALLLDEFGQMDPRIAGEVAYMLANGSAKSRSSRTGQARQTLTWRLLFITTGEVSLAQHMGEAGKRPRAGQELRIVDVPADAGVGRGVFEELHGFDSGAALSRYLVQAAGRTYGTLAQAFIRWCVDHPEELRSQLHREMERFAHAAIPEAAGGQVDRVGRRFALVAAAGEIASAAGLTGWPAGEAAQGVRTCFDAWLATRGGLGNAEEMQMLRQVRAFLERHGESRFHWWHRAADDRSPNTPNRAGFRKLVNEDGTEVSRESDHVREFGQAMSPRDGERTLTEFFVLREVFRDEVAHGFDASAVARILADRGHLVTEKSGRLDRKERLPGLGLTRCYRIKPSLFEDDGE